MPLLLPPLQLCSHALCPLVCVLAGFEMQLCKGGGIAGHAEVAAGASIKATLKSATTVRPSLQAAQKQRHEAQSAALGAAPIGKLLKVSFRSPDPPTNLCRQI